MARLPFYLGGNEVHEESPADRLRREAREREARELLSRAAAMGRITPSLEPVAAPPPSVAASAAPMSTATSARVAASGRDGGGGVSRANLPPARARMLEVVETESPSVAAYLRETMGIEEPQEEVRQRMLGVNLGRAGAMLNEAISGARYDRAAYDGLAEEAQRPLADAMARESLSRQEWQDNAGERERTARLQGMEDERADRTTDRRLAMAQDARAQDQRVEDATRADARFNIERQDDAAARADAARRWEAEMELRRQETAARTARASGGIGLSGLPPEERLMKATVSARLSPLVASLERIDQILPGSIYGGANAGGVDAWSRAVINAPGGFGSWLASDRGLALTREVQQLRDVVSRARSGAALTAQEEANYLRLLDDAALADPRSLAVGLDIIRREIGQKLQDINAGFDPSVVQTYQQRGGTTAQSPMFSGGGQRSGDVDLNTPAPTGRRATMPDGSVWEELSDGSSRQVR